MVGGVRLLSGSSLREGSSFLIPSMKAVIGVRPFMPRP